MPLLIYGAELTRDLNEEEELSINNFTFFIDDQSWEEFMPSGVTKKTFESFKKYYDPDIFRAAGRRIREMAKAADSLSIEQRVQKAWFFPWLYGVLILNVRRGSSFSHENRIFYCVLLYLVDMSVSWNTSPLL